MVTLESKDSDGKSSNEVLQVDNGVLIEVTEYRNEVLDVTFVDHEYKGHDPPPPEIR